MRSYRKARQLASARRRLGRFAASVLVILVTAFGTSFAHHRMLAGPLSAIASGPTPLSMICVSPDITVALSSGTVTPQQVQCYSFPSGTAATSFAGIPAGANVSGFLPVSPTQILLTIDITAALPINGVGGTVTVTPHDVASYNPATGLFSSALFFAGISNGVADGTRIDAIGKDGSGNLLLSFDVTISLPKSGGGTLTVKPADLVSFNGSAYTLVFDSAAAGIPDGMILDGATMLPNADLLMAFDQFGSIDGVDFTPTDVLEFNHGENSWVLSLSGAAADDWPDGSIIQGVYAQAAASPTPTATATTTATATATQTATSTATATNTATATATATNTATATATQTATATNTATATATNTATATATNTATNTATATATNTATATATNTATATLTATPTTSISVPASLAMGNAPVGDTVTKNITVKNTGTNLLFMGGVTSNDPEFAATGATTCSGGGLGHLATCTIAIGFTPSALGMHSATLLVHDNASSSPQHVAASGDGIADMTVTPTSFMFTSTKIGSEKTKTITVSNKQTNSVSLTMPPSFSGNNPTDFSVTGGSCLALTPASTLAAKTACTLIVAYAPSALGTESATMAVTDSPDTLGPYSVTFTTPENIPATVTPTTLAFGTLTARTPSKTKNITVANLSGFSLSVSESSVSGANAGDFAVTSATCGASVAAHSPCTIAITFTPTAGPSGESASIAVSIGSDPTSPHNIALMGTGP